MKGLEDGNAYQCDDLWIRVEVEQPSGELSGRIIVIHLGEHADRAPEGDM